MFPLGHIGITVFLASLLSLSPLYAISVVLIPDIIDKPLNILGLAPFSRYIGHTLFLGFLLSSIVFLFTRKKIISLSILFGYYIHLLEDTGFIPWFFPFIRYDFPVEPFRIKYTLLQFTLDVVGFILLWFTFKTNSKFRNDVIEFTNILKIKANNLFNRNKQLSKMNK